MKKYIIKECKHHGPTDFVLEGRGYYRCKQCRQDRVAEQRRKNKIKLIKHFGNKCHICNYDRCAAALEFHHIDKTTKSFALAQSGLTKSYNKLLVEANKCILLCANCHREVENNVTTIPDGATAARMTVNH